MRVCGGLSLSPRVRFSWNGGDVWRCLSSSPDFNLIKNHIMYVVRLRRHFVIWPNDDDSSSRVIICWLASLAMDARSTTSVPWYMSTVSKTSRSIERQLANESPHADLPSHRPTYIYAPFHLFFSKSNNSNIEDYIYSGNTSVSDLPLPFGRRNKDSINERNAAK